MVASTAATRADDPPPRPALERDVVAHGTVFQDNDGNGRLGPADRPLAGVQVSDGEHVLRTGPDGNYRFRLRVEEYRFILLTKPTGWKTVGPFFRRIDPTDSKTDYTFNFPLAEDPPSRSQDFNFLASADSQFSSEEAGRLLREEFAQITQQAGSPAFFVIAGDLTAYGTVQEIQWYVAAAAEFTIPSYHVFGGHDGNYARGKDYPGTGHFEEMIGPVTFSWDYGGRHFVAFVTEESYMSPAARQRQRAWLENDARAQPPGTEFVIVSHYPPGADRLDMWSRRGRVRLCIYGHWHELNVYEYRGIPHVVTAPARGRDWGALTRSYRILTFRDGRLSGELRWTGQYWRLAIVNPPPGGRVSRGRIPLQVIAYNTPTHVVSAHCSVRALNGDGDTVTMDLSSSDPRGWTWRGILDTRRLTPGPYRLAVTVTDETGASWSKAADFTVEARPLAAPNPTDDWLSIFRDGMASRAVERALRPPLVLAWAVPTGGSGVLGAAPVIRDGVIYLGVQDDEIGWPGAAVAAYDARSGRRLWRTPVDSSIKNAPTLHGDALFVVSAQGYVYRLDPSSGRIQWKATVYEEPEIAGHRIVKGGVAVGAGRVAVQDDYGHGVIMDATNGRVLHRSDAVGQAYYATPAIRGRAAYFPGRSMTTAVDVYTGSTLWKTETTGTRGLSTCATTEDRVYLNARRFHCFDARRGDILWTAPVAGGAFGMFPPVLGARRVYCGGSTLSALDAETGESAWTFDAGQKPVSFENNRRQTLGGMSSPLVAGDVLFWGGDDGFLYALDAKTGREVWSYFLGVPIKAAPIVSGNALYLVDFDGNLCAFVEEAE